MKDSPIISITTTTMITNPTKLPAREKCEQFQCEQQWDLTHYNAYYFTHTKICWKIYIMNAQCVFDFILYLPLGFGGGTGVTFRTVKKKKCYITYGQRVDHHTTHTLCKKKRLLYCITHCEWREVRCYMLCYV